mmetsp:Transcript_10280/g.24080  ORF Transcript_10280/g.24080 Transcript_10280/m.24080 type:complete len:209 (-) Transcript_10280:108-734(-)
MTSLISSMIWVSGSSNASSCSPLPEESLSCKDIVPEKRAVAIFFKDCISVSTIHSISLCSLDVLAASFSLHDCVRFGRDLPESTESVPILMASDDAVEDPEFAVISNLSWIKLRREYSLLRFPRDLIFFPPFEETKVPETVEVDEDRSNQYVCISPLPLTTTRCFLSVTHLSWPSAFNKPAVCALIWILWTWPVDSIRLAVLTVSPKS